MVILKDTTGKWLISNWIRVSPGQHMDIRWHTMFGRDFMAGSGEWQNPQKTETQMLQIWEDQVLSQFQLHMSCNRFQLVSSTNTNNPINPQIWLIIWFDYVSIWPGWRDSSRRSPRFAAQVRPLILTIYHGLRCGQQAFKLKKQELKGQQVLLLKAKHVGQWNNGLKVKICLETLRTIFFRIRFQSCQWWPCDVSEISFELISQPWVPWNVFATKSYQIGLVANPLEAAGSAHCGE